MTSHQLCLFFSSPPLFLAVEKEKIKEIDWIDITNNSIAEKETSKKDKELLRRLHVKDGNKVMRVNFKPIFSTTASNIWNNYQLPEVEASVLSI